MFRGDFQQDLGGAAGFATALFPILKRVRGWPPKGNRSQKVTTSHDLKFSSRMALFLQLRGDVSGPHGRAIRQHDGHEKEEKPAADPDARHAAGFEREHKNRHHEDIQHGPFAEVRNEFVESFRLVRRQPRIQPERNQGVDFHERKTDREHEQYQKEKQFARVPKYLQAVEDRNLIVEQPEFRNRGEWKKDAREKTGHRCEQHE